MRTAFVIVVILLLSTKSRAQGPTQADQALDRVIERVNADPAPKKETIERPDGWITTKVKSSLLLHKSVSGLATKVETKDGVVTLTGEAANQAQKDLAAEYTADIEGVKSVDNRMTVKGERSMDSRVDDATITTLVKGALLSRRSTSAINTSVKTVGGVVTLGGLARNEDEKELAEKLAKGVRGVKSVVNRMNVE